MNNVTHIFAVVDERGFVHRDSFYFVHMHKSSPTEEYAIQFQAIQKFLKSENVAFWKRWFLPKKTWRFYTLLGFKVVKFKLIEDK